MDWLLGRQRAQPRVDEAATGRVPAAVRCETCAHPKALEFKPEDGGLEVLLLDALNHQHEGSYLLSLYVDAFGRTYGHHRSRRDPHAHGDVVFIPAEDIGHPYWAVVAVAHEFSAQVDMLAASAYAASTGPVGYLEALVSHLLLLAQYPHNRQVLIHHGVPAAMLQLLACLTTLCSREHAGENEIGTVDMNTLTGLTTGCLGVLQHLRDPLFTYRSYLLTWALQDLSGPEQNMQPHVDPMVEAVLTALKVFVVQATSTDATAGHLSCSLVLAEECLHTLGCTIQQSPDAAGAFQRMDGVSLVSEALTSLWSVLHTGFDADLLVTGLRVGLAAVRLLHMVYMLVPSCRQQMDDMGHWPHVTHFLCWVAHTHQLTADKTALRGLNTSLAEAYPSMQTHSLGACANGSLSNVPLTRTLSDWPVPSGGSTMPARPNLQPSGLKEPIGCGRALGLVLQVVESVAMDAAAHRRSNTLLSVGRRPSTVEAEAPATATDKCVILSVLDCFRQPNVATNEPTALQWLSLEFILRLLEARRSCVVHLNGAGWLDLLLSPSFCGQHGIKQTGRLSTLEGAVLDVAAFSACQPHHTNQPHMALFLRLLAETGIQERTVAEICDRLLTVLGHNQSAAQLSLYSLEYLDTLAPLMYTCTATVREGHSRHPSDAAVNLCLVFTAATHNNKLNGLQALGHILLLDTLGGFLSEGSHGSSLWPWALSALTALLACAPPQIDQRLLKALSVLLDCFPPPPLTESRVSLCLSLLAAINRLVVGADGPRNQEALVLCGCFQKLVGIMDLPADEPPLQLDLLAQVLQTLANIMGGSEVCREAFEREVGYERLQQSLVEGLAGEVTRPMVDILLAMVVEGKSGGVSPHLRNTDVLQVLLRLIFASSAWDLQLYVLLTLTDLVMNSRNNLAKCCAAGLVPTLLRLLPDLAQEYQVEAWTVMEQLIVLVETLGRHSILPEDLRLIMALLAPNPPPPSKPVYFDRLLQAMQSMAGAHSPRACFSFDATPAQGLFLPPMPKPVGATGFTFHTWVRLELPEMPVHPYSPCVFALHTDRNQGIELFLDDSLQLTYSTYTDSTDPPQSISIPGAPLEYGQWASIALVHSKPHGPWNTTEVFVYVNGTLRHKASCRFPPVAEVVSIAVASPVPERVQLSQSTSMAGQLGSVLLFNELLQPQAVSAIHQLGPSYQLCFDPSDIGTVPSRMEWVSDGRLSTYLIANFNALACTPEKTCPNVVSRPGTPTRQHASVVGEVYATWHVADSIVALGGLPLVCLLIGRLGDQCALPPLDTEPVRFQLRRAPVTTNSSSLAVIRRTSRASVLSLSTQTSDYQIRRWSSSLSLGSEQDGRSLASFNGGLEGLRQSTVPTIITTDTNQQPVGRRFSDAKTFQRILSTESALSPAPSISSIRQQSDNVSLGGDREHLVVASTPTARFFAFLADLARSSQSIRDALNSREAVGTISLLVGQLGPESLGADTVMAVGALVDVVLDYNHSAAAQNIKDDSGGEDLFGSVPTLHRQLLFDFGLWAPTDTATQAALVQHIFTIIKDNTSVYRKAFGVSFFLDVLQMFYSAPAPKGDETAKAEGIKGMTTQEVASLRQSLLSIIRVYMKGGVLREEMEALCSFVVISVDPVVTGEVIDLLHSHVLGTGPDRTGVTEGLLGVWGSKPEWLYGLLRSPHDQIRLPTLRLITTLMASDRVSDKVRRRLRLEGIGYGGLAEEMGHYPITVDLMAALVTLACEPRKSVPGRRMSGTQTVIANPDVVLLLVQLLSGPAVDGWGDQTGLSPRALRLHALHVISQTIDSNRTSNSTTLLSCARYPLLLLLLHCEDQQQTVTALSDLTELHCPTAMLLDILDSLLVSQMGSEPSGWRLVESAVALIQAMPGLDPAFTRRVCYHLLCRLCDSLAAQAATTPHPPSPALVNNGAHLCLVAEMFLFYKVSDNTCTLLSIHYRDTTGPNFQWRLAAAVLSLARSLNIAHSSDFSFLEPSSPATRPAAPPQKMHRDPHRSSHLVPGGMQRVCLRLCVSLVKQSDPEACAVGVQTMHTLLLTPPTREGAPVVVPGDLMAYGLLGVSEALQLCTDCPDDSNARLLLPLLTALLRQFGPAITPMLEHNTHNDNSGEDVHWLSSMQCLVSDQSDTSTMLHAATHPVWVQRVRETMGLAVTQLVASEKEGFVHRVLRRHTRQQGEAEAEWQRQADMQAASQRAFREQVLAPVFDIMRDQLARTHRRDHNLRERTRRLQAYWAGALEFFNSERALLSQPTDQHWRLSRTENFSRMRLYLVPNKSFDPHTDASKYRDCGDEPQQQPAVMHEIDEVAIDQFDGNSIVDVTGMEADGRVIYTTFCEMVALMTVTAGRLEITEKTIFFYADASDADSDDPADLRHLVDAAPRDHQWPVDNIREIHLRTYLLRGSALEIFLVDQTNYFLNFPRKDRERVYQSIGGLRPKHMVYFEIMPPQALLSASNLTTKWQRRLISNFDYLMHLNTIAGRTYNDLNQYPVFPWVLCDYDSPTLDLNDPKVYRDLSKPMGALDPARLSIVQQRYKEFFDPSGTIDRFHYGSHYSTAGGVLFYLLRLEPFTTLHIHLQGGRFDHADRQFHSIPATWRSCTSALSDVKELIPEFFYLPDFLVNANNFDLGTLQGGTALGDVILPPWAKTPEEFVRINREALESDYVSDHLHEWVDLIFGYKQRGPAAVEATNVFYYVTYEGAVDLDAISDPKERAGIEAQINNFGQTPSQLLTVPHPPRGVVPSPQPIPTTAYPVQTTPSKSQVDTPASADRRNRAFQQCRNLRAYFQQLHEVSGPVSLSGGALMHVALPGRQVTSHMQAGMAHRIVTVSAPGQLAAHTWLDQPQDGVPFTFERDPAFSTSIRYAVRHAAPDMVLDHGLFAVSHDGRYVFSGAHWDYSFKMVQVDSGRVVASVARHTGPVTSLALDPTTGLLLATASRDRTVQIWQLASPLGSAPFIRTPPLHTLLGHHSAVTAVALSTELDIVVSGSQEGIILVHTVRQGRLLRTISAPGHTPRSLQPGIQTIHLTADASMVVATQGTHKTNQVLRVYNPNGKLLTSRTMSDPVTCLVTNGRASHLVTGSVGGSLTVWKLHSLKQVCTYGLYAAIHSLALTPRDNYIICGLADGKLIFLCPPAQKDN